MRKIVVFLAILFALAIPVSALEYTPPEAPDDALELIPVEKDSFGKDLLTVLQRAVDKLVPSIPEAMGVCLSLVATGIMLSVVQATPGKWTRPVELAAVLGVSVILLQSTGSMISLAAGTVQELSEYGKLLLPVMAAALASQGGLTTSAALYTGTAIFDAVISQAISRALVPFVYLFMILSVMAAATGEKMLSSLRDLSKSAVTWLLKTALYIFTGYMGITGVVSGTTDAAALKATKLTISGMIPVVGGVLSDASEAVLVSAGLMKNAVGVYGMVALIAIWIWPFLQIGIQYLMLKITAAICGLFEVKPLQELISAFSSAMGLLLGMTGAVCVLLLISMVCFLKGVS